MVRNPMTSIYVDNGVWEKKFKFEMKGMCVNYLRVTWEYGHVTRLGFQHRWGSAHTLAYN